MPGEGVLNFHFGIGVQPKGPQRGLKEQVGTKNRGRHQKWGLKELIFG